MRILVLTMFLLALHLRGAAPHLVVFISDDLGIHDTSVYGSRNARTPNLKRLADQGMTFDRAYVASPSCCPNRYSLLTGLMPARHGAHPNHSQPKPATRNLLPELRQRGYHVASFGKIAHSRQRFEGLDHHHAPTLDLARQVRSHLHEVPTNQPVCLLVGDRRPHVPWIKESTYDPGEVTLPSWFIDTPETRRHWARYLTDISGMDMELGQVINLAQEKWGTNVLYLFTSDHGGQWHMGKWNLYDTGARIPLIVSWPGRIEPGSRSDAMVSWVDLLPTLIDLAGGRVPNGIDGRSFKDVLIGRAKVHRERIFTTHTGDGTMNVFPIRAVRIGDHKLIHNLRPDCWFTNHSDRLRKDGAGAFWDSWDAAAKINPQAAETLRRYYTRPEFELFDLSRDPFELDNLANRPDQRSRLNSMLNDLRKWTREQGDDLKPHQEPYPRLHPLPDLTGTAGRKR
jgi:N-sulfoglucosamine sulfohydrolase